MTLVKKKVSQLPAASTLVGLIVLGIDSLTNKSCKVTIDLLKGNKGDTGNTGATLELQKSDTHVQWRVVGTETWYDLITLVSLVGAKGDKGDTGNTGATLEMQKSDTHIQWRVVGSETWIDMVELSSLVGAKGDTGATLELQVSGGYIQWRPVGTVNWTNLVLVSDLVQIEQARSQSTTKVASSKLFDDELNKKAVFNVTTEIPLSAGQYYTPATAKAAVPTGVKKLGLSITYAISAGIWITEQFKGTNVSTWTTVTDWQIISNERAIKTNLFRNSRFLNDTPLLGSRPAGTVIKESIYLGTDGTKSYVNAEPIFGYNGRAMNLTFAASVSNFQICIPAMQIMYDTKFIADGVLNFVMEIYSPVAVTGIVFRIYTSVSGVETVQGAEYTTNIAIGYNLVTFSRTITTAFTDNLANSLRIRLFTYSAWASQVVSFGRLIVYSGPVVNALNTMDFYSPAEITLTDVPVYNVTYKIPKSSGYYTPTTARAAVPTEIKKTGLQIIYEIAAGIWITERFKGTSISTWATDADWKIVSNNLINKANFFRNNRFINDTGLTASRPAGTVRKESIYLGTNGTLSFANAEPIFGYNGRVMNITFASSGLSNFNFVIPAMHFMYDPQYIADKVLNFSIEIYSPVVVTGIVFRIYAVTGGSEVQQGDVLTTNLVVGYNLITFSRTLSSTFTDNLADYLQFRLFTYSAWASQVVSFGRFNIYSGPVMNVLDTWDIAYPPDQDAEVTTIAQGVVDSYRQNYWLGKKLVTLGDSITAQILWQPEIVRRIGLVWSATETQSGASGHAVMGVGGSMVTPHITGTTGQTAGLSMYARADDVDYYSPNIIMILGGQNDSTSNIGTAEDTPYAGAEVTENPPTFCASYMGMLVKLITQNPTAKIICLTLTYGTDHSYAQKIAKVNAIKACAAKYNLQVIDLFGECGINSINHASFIADGIHPSAAGGLIMGSLISSKL
ncbi:MAG: SGNH/GDSL hydrolase family protein [Bacteroidales bacterium]|jgi:lysophospholipase L1-like esterase